MAPATTNYGDIQQDEIDVLRSIYMDDFSEEQAKTCAWNKKADRTFSIQLRGLPGDEDNVACTLQISFPTTYPKSLPYINISFQDSVRAQTKMQALEIVTEKPKALIGSEMIYELTTLVQEVLISQNATKNLPNLDEERAAREAQVAIAKSEQEEIERRHTTTQLEATENAQEEERLLRDLVERENARNLQRKTNKVSKEIRPSTILNTNIDATVFDQPSRLHRPDGRILHFTAVFDKVLYRTGAISTVFTVQPWLEEQDKTKRIHNISDSPFLILKEYHIHHSEADTGLKDALQNLENRLESQMKHLKPHQSVISTLNYLISRSESSGWKISILTEMASKGSLMDLLELIGQLDANRIRVWALQMLEGLHHYHRNNSVHGCLHLTNVVLEQGEAKNTVVKLSDGGYSQMLYFLQSTSPDERIPLSWNAPEIASKIKATKPPRQSSKSPSVLSVETMYGHQAAEDIWQFGICLLQMGLGKDVMHEYRSPAALLDDLRTSLSASFVALLRRVFDSDPRKRPSAWDLLHFEFFRKDDTLFDAARNDSGSVHDLAMMTAPVSTGHNRRESAAAAPLSSRYAKEFSEDGRLGRGGFGEVFRARNRVDGQPYAVKKVKARSRSALDPVLSEASVLSRLNHPNVVRYYASWIEDAPAEGTNADTLASSGVDSSSSLANPGQGAIAAMSSRGLDFISSNNIHIEFGTDPDDNVVFGDVDEQENTSYDDSCSTSSNSDAGVDTDLDLGDKQSDVVSHPEGWLPSHQGSSAVLYIQMEYCKPETLRNVINAGIQAEQSQAYRLLRQILQGLAHIHASSIVHRDLKPENIFIDGNGDIRIGDFGLARPGDYRVASPHEKSEAQDDFTKDVGTASYIAPEVLSGTGLSRYNEKADMYSLGIIFFEMNAIFATGMERAEALAAVRRGDQVSSFILDSPQRLVQVEIIESLMQRDPSLRPSSTELLESGRIPLQEEDEIFRMAHRLVLDPTSHLRHDLLHSLFPRETNPEAISTANSTRQTVAQKMAILDDVSAMSRSLPEDLELQTIVKQRLASIFQRHGAIERTDSPALFPYHPCYPSSQVLQFLAPTGKVLQLPYDLVLPNAMLLARTVQPVQRRSYIFDNVYRVDALHNRPSIFGEANFDIVSRDSEFSAMHDAEALKTIDEVLDAFPNLTTASMCFHINHSLILDAILQCCEVEKDKWPAVKETISKLNTAEWTWLRIRHELRASPISIAGTCLDELEQFDFRELLDNGFSRLRSLLPQAAELEPTFDYIQRVAKCLTSFGVRRAIYLSPLSSYNEKFYQGNIIFQCLYDHKRKSVFAAGGRYDRLIRDHQPVTSLKNRTHAVGFQLTWSGLSMGMTNYLKAQAKSKSKRKPHLADSVTWNSRRCDILVDSFDHKLLTSVGIELLKEIWANGISAELAEGNHDVPNEYLKQESSQEGHSWIVLIKSDTIIKVKNLVRKEDTEVSIPEALAFLRSEIRERDREESRSTLNKPPSLPRQTSHIESVGNSTDRDPEIKILLSQNKGKKVNRKAVVEEALLLAQEWRTRSCEYPIIAIETKGAIFHAIEKTSLQDPDSWKRLIQDAPAGERVYLGQIRSLLESHQGGGSPAAFIYNFRTKQIMDYHVRR